jgi:hypothetical protein
MKRPTTNLTDSQWRLLDGILQDAQKRDHLPGLKATEGLVKILNSIPIPLKL